jgi:translation initiation factor IF-2
MSEGGKQKKLFKVAKEFNVATQTIVDTLKDAGYTISNRPNENVSEEMISALEAHYGIDKARNQEHERLREEYEQKRTQPATTRRADVFDLESLLEPIEEAPKATKTETVADVAPQVEPEPVVEVKPPAPEPVVVPEVAKKPEPVAPAPEPAKTEPVKAPVVEVKAEPKPEAKPQEVVESQKDEAKVEVAKAPVKEDKPAEIPAVAQEAEEDEEVIRAKTDKLQGTRLLGKIEIRTKEEIAADGGGGRGRKKRKKKAGATTDAAPKPATTTATGDAASKDKKPKAKVDDKKKKGKQTRTVDTEDVNLKMRETMALMSGGGAGKKRQKRRKMKREEMAADREQQAIMDEMEGSILEVTEFITVSDLAELLNVQATKVIGICLQLGLMVSINQRLDAATIELIATEFNREIRFVGADDILDDFEEEDDSPEDLEGRAPIVTVMGHVDHGKTSLLDHIRNTRVAAGEAGGITQHVGAYAVSLPDGRKITFLDTPGHEAFTAMRARGAQVTDIVILVVAADDSVMPQTIEAINHAQAAGVPLVVAVNKIDKADANPDKIKQQLLEHNVVVEDYGGKSQVALISAKNGTGIDELLEKVLIEAELMELKANPNRNASGIVLEARIDKGKGVVANLLVQTGTVSIGDVFVAGQVFGRVRAMENELGQRIQSAGPSTPIQIIGFDGMPQAGDKLVCTDDEKKAREVAQQRQQIKREQDMRLVRHLTLDDISRRMALGEVVDLNLIIKGDVDGSIEALSGSLLKLSTDEVQVNIIHTGVGAISESDVLLASASDAIIIGFQVRPTANARKLAEVEQIDIRLFSVIYDAVDAIKDAMEGMLSPELNEKITSTVEVRETFKVPNVGTVAGCMVTDGKIHRNTRIRLIRDGIVAFTGEIDTLRRFKDDVREVASGYECGISIKNFNDIKVGDVIESFEIVETKRKLTTS